VSVVISTPQQVKFSLPDELAATEPPEARGLARDEVRLLVAEPHELRHVIFRDIGRFLRAGDLLVVNVSATLPGAVAGSRATGQRVAVHFSTWSDDGSWVIELRAPDGSGPVLDAVAGEEVCLQGGGAVMLAAPQLRLGGGARLWQADVRVPGSVEKYLAEHGRPITYGYVPGRWPLSIYQTVFGLIPGSAEMASAGRPFTERLVTQLVSRGIVIAPILLHAGVSSLDADEAAQPERFSVPETTAALVRHTRRTGGRVIAIGTTATRALETVARPDGSVVAGEGWTDVVLGPDRPARVIDGLVTGWHAPRASHLSLLEAVAGTDLVSQAYEAALEARYLWHEFGDSCLFLPGRRR
jgi:S-adenosylmethionine:tRNA ribosyltransferase-isomerase